MIFVINFKDNMEKYSTDKPPRHIAIIMDGNGRWAKKRMLPRVLGHRKGIDVARDTVAACRELGVEYLTLFTFSRENWNRPASEVKIIMGLLEKHLKLETGNLVENNIRFRAVGNLAELPESVRKVIGSVEAATRDNDGMVLQLALSYSGRDEILAACRSLIKSVAEGGLKPEELTEETFSRHLYTAGAPDPDLLIRTSGERRVSNFLLWQLAYTEIYITDVHWPDFTREHLEKAIRDFQSRERRFGLTGEQCLGALG
jgi:undecaprenyl diphosphate synthase